MIQIPELGEVVYHKSGGPKLVVREVTSLTSRDVFRCEYFNEVTGQFNWADFLLHELVVGDKSGQEEG